jgi:hypothetical protein
MNSLFLLLFHRIFQADSREEKRRFLAGLIPYEVSLSRIEVVQYNLLHIFQFCKKGLNIGKMLTGPAIIHGVPA